MTSQRNRRVLMAMGVALLVLSLPLMLAAGGEEHEHGDEERFGDDAEFGDDDDGFEEASEPPWGREAGDGFSLPRLLNRVTAETGFLVLTLAAVGGVLRRPGSPAPVRRLASAAHYYVAFLALALVLIHSATGLPEILEAFAELGGGSLGMALGVGGTAALVLGGVAHLVPRWFGGSWPAITVHAVVYSAFAATAIHSAAVGHETGTYVGGVVLVLLALLLTRMNRGRAAPAE